MADPQEEWRSIPGWEGLYEASSYGRIRSCERDILRDGNVIGRYYAYVLKTNICPHGYEQLVLQRGGRNERAKVHRLVCEAFHGPRPTSKHQVAHGDGNSRNNHESNLRWATAKENAADRIRHGTNCPGEKNGNAKFTNEQVREIRRRRLHERGIDLAKEFGVDQVTICRIVRGHNYREASAL